MKIICIGRNYAEHVKELHNTAGGPDGLPTEPVFFLKPDTALLRNNDPFYIPSFSQEVHYECELVVRINRVGKCIEERFAHRYYDEVGLGIDFTAATSNARRSPEGSPGSVPRASTTRRPCRPNSSRSRSWAATCSGFTSN